MRLLIASSENDSRGHRARILTELGNKYWLQSYLYLRKSAVKMAIFKSVMEVKSFFLLDSGAHSLQQAGRSVDYDKFVREYAEFVAEHPRIDQFAELDIDNKVGLVQVEKWRNELIRITGRTPIVVWHPTEGVDYWRHIVKKYPYVGIPCVGAEVPERFWKWMLDTAHGAGAQVHGFGMTRPECLLRYPFDTVDSSSWTAGSRYGVYYVFEGGRLQQCSKMQRKNGVAVQYRQQDYINAKAWVDLQRFCEEHWARSKQGAAG